jgi:hypothetical protein
MDKELALERARRGAAFLDEKLGRGWRRKIRRSRLSMADGIFDPGVAGGWGYCGCIVAQLSPRHAYNDVYNLLGLDPYNDEVIDFGLILDDDDEDIDEEKDYALLTEAWREVLREKVPS